jgi:Asp-tRNA(Asn)/Glu-tRNA(Gln) amidotransferase C subunit
VITICTDPARCAGMEGAHAALSAQLADALAQVQLLQAALLAQEEATAAVMADNNRLRKDYEFHFEGFKAQCRRQEATR